MLRLSLAQVRARYVEVIGEAPRSRSRVQLVRRIAWRLQAREEGDLSERARQRAEELAADADFRIGPPAPPRPSQTAANHAGRQLVAPSGMPMPGASLNRRYKGKHIQVTVLDDGFEYEGARYNSLSAVAKAITGAHWNGRLFFGLKPSPPQAKEGRNS